MSAHSRIATACGMTKAEDPRDHEIGTFWNSFAGVTPESYAATIAEDGDSWIEDYSLEDALIGE